MGTVTSNACVHFSDPDYSQLPWWNASGGGPTEESSLAGGGVGRGKWGAGWSAAQIGSWFEEYGAVIVGYAKLAEEQHVDAFHVGEPTSCADLRL